MDAGYTGQDKGADWVQKALGWSTEILRPPPKLVPEDVMSIWMREWAKEGVQIDREKLQGPKYPRAAYLPIRWIVERTFSWLGQNRMMRLWTMSVRRRAEKPSSTLPRATLWSDV